MREFARRHEIVNYFELGRMGIEHALLPEAGLVRPGMVIVGADSHTCTYGALGAFATGMGSTDLAAAWITGWTWLKVPPSLKFVFSGTPQPWVGGKDYILAVLGRIGVDGALYSAMEFAGEAIAALGIDGRLTMCNMAIEGGGKNGIIAADAVTDAYLAERSDAPYVKYRERPRRSVRRRPRDRRQPARAAGGPAAFAGQRRRHQPDRRGADRPGLRRLLHERAHLRPARGRPGAARPAGPPPTCG